jgi:predicted RNase H-like nuclease (RuvC/YqgF family)
MFKSIFKVGIGLVILTGAAVGAALLIGGPVRTSAALHSLHSDLLECIDDNIDDPAALRSQLKQLEGEYPVRIKAVSRDLAEVREQIRQLSRDQAISDRVVEMALADLETLEPAVSEAMAKRASGQVSRATLVSWSDRVYSFDRASNQVTQMRQTVVAYTNRAADAMHDLGYLQQQELRLDELLGTLESERSQFQSQIFGLSRQVDAIARNERLIELIDKRNRTIEECSRYDAVSLDHLTARLAEVRSRQEAELDILSNSQHQHDYEDMARAQISIESMGSGRHARTLPLPAAQQLKPISQTAGR